MRTILKLAVVILFFAACKNETAVKDTTVTAIPELSSGQTAVYYFHNKKRCATCIAIEDQTQEVLAKYFASALATKSVVFYSFDIGSDASAALEDKYKVAGQTLLIINDKGQSNLTNEAFLYARSSPDIFKGLLKDALSKYISDGSFSE